MIDKRSNIPYYIQIKTDLLDKINKNIYNQNDKIPTENELSNLYGVSRVTIREAVKELVKDNILEVIKGKGMFVKPITLTPLPGIDKVASFSNILSAKGLKTISKVLELKKSFADKRISKILSITKNSSVIYLKRVRYIENNPAVLTEAYLKYELCSDIIDINLNKNELFYSIEKILGIKIRSIKRIIETELSNDEQSDYLNIKKNSPVIYMQSFIYTEKNLLFGYIEDFFKKEFARFEFDISY